MGLKQFWNFIFNKDDRESLMRLSIVFGLCILISFILSILYSLNIMASFLVHFVNNDLSFPAYCLIAGSLLGIPMFNFFKMVVNSYEKGKALSYILLLLGLFCVLCLLLEHYLNLIFPVFSQLLIITTTSTLVLLGIYAMVMDKLKN